MNLSVAKSGQMRTMVIDCCCLLGNAPAVALIRVALLSGYLSINLTLQRQSITPDHGPSPRICFVTLYSFLLAQLDVSCQLGIGKILPQSEYNTQKLEQSEENKDQ